MLSIKNISEIISRYDLFLLDLWGVIHDGSALYPGVKAALDLLKTQNKQVIFISNAPRRSHRVMSVLKGFGIGEGDYLAAVSSGEVGYQWLAEGHAPWGKKYYYLGPAKDADVLDGLDYIRVDDIKAADFLLNVGFGSEEQTTDDFTMLLHAARGLGMPMLCLNPDLEVVKITGERHPCAGVIGRQYEVIGGKVTWFGKPYAEIYDMCLAGLNVPKQRILAVGDSLETDIPGGQNYGIDTLLITGGILKHQSFVQIQEMCMQLGLRPNYVADAFN